MYDQQILEVFEDLTPWQKLSMILVVIAAKRDDWILAAGLRDFAVDGEPSETSGDIEADYELMRRLGAVCPKGERLIWAKLANLVHEQGNQLDIDRFEELALTRTAN